MKKLTQQQAGFSFIEIMMVVGIMGVLLSIIVSNLMRPQQQLSLDTVVSTVAADLRSQQLRSMTGETDATGSATPLGVYFEQGKYTLFQGSVYNPSNVQNFAVPLSSQLQFVSIQIPSSQILFQRVSGEVQSFDPAKNFVTLKNTSTNESKTLRVNRLGVVTIE